MFGYPGGAILPAYDAMLDYPIRHVLVRHEQGATHMADGYARATGQVGVAIATSGPGATNLVTGIATAMMDSSPIVCITGQVGSKLIGSDAFQETDITGITLPITKHNYLVTRAEDIAPTVREAFHVARSGRPGPVLVDITKDAQQSVVRVRLGRRRAEAARLPARRTGRARARSSRRVELIHAAKRPVILAGHGIIDVGRDARSCASSPSSTNIPVAMTLLGLGGFPASHPLNLGMMGMHGEAWVNTRDPGSRPAARLRHALRRPRHRQPQDLRAERQEDPHRHRPGRDQQERHASTSAWSATSREALEELLPHVEPATAREWLAHIDDAEGRLGGPRHPEPARQRPPLRRARDQRHLAR